MKPTMKVRVTQAYPLKSFEGVVQLPNLTATKLRKEDGSTRYATVSNLKQAAVAAAKKYNARLVFEQPKRLAAKKSTSR